MNISYEIKTDRLLTTLSVGGKTFREQHTVDMNDNVLIMGSIERQLNSIGARGMAREWRKLSNDGLQAKLITCVRTCNQFDGNGNDMPYVAAV